MYPAKKPMGTNVMGPVFCSRGLGVRARAQPMTGSIAIQPKKGQ